jgi:hypothetical protein
MTTQNKWIIAGCVVIAVLTTGSAAYYFKHRSGPNPAKMNAAQIQTYMQSPDFNNMPREQRGEFFGKLIDSRVQTYFATSEQERDKYLDTIIDDMQNFRPRNFDSPRIRNPNRDPNMMQRMQQRFANATPEQRRAFRETRDPVQDAKRREFFMALRGRAQARGVQMGGFGGGRGGGNR